MASDMRMKATRKREIGLGGSKRRLIQHAGYTDSPGDLEVLY